MDSNKYNVFASFGNLKYVFHYDGTPNSGDVGYDWYSSNKSRGHDFSIGFSLDGSYVVSVSLPLKEVFPYMKMYSDSNGNISLNDFNAILSDDGIYGRNFRSTVDGGLFDAFSPAMKNKYTSDAYFYYFNNYNATIMLDKNRNININDSICHFTISD